MIYLLRLPRALAMIAGQLGLILVGTVAMLIVTAWAALTSDSVAEALAKMDRRR